MVLGRHNLFLQNNVQFVKSSHIYWYSYFGLGHMLARYGGEEFVCLLPDTGLSGALEVAERLRERVAVLQIPHGASSVSEVVSISLGACTKAEETAGTAAALLREADAQLYLAKSGGRNRCCAAELGDFTDQAVRPVASPKPATTSTMEGVLAIQ